MPEPRLTDHQVVQLNRQPTLAVRIRKPMSEVDMSALFDTHLPKIHEEINSRGYEIAGPPFVRYHEFGPEWADVELGTPLVEAPTEGRRMADLALEQIGISELPGGLVAKVLHHGPYHTLGDAYGPFHDWIHSQGHDEGAGPWESYIRESGAEPDPDDLETEIYWPTAAE
ncbi:MAG: GyrI-like domain-containing protein [Acidimicrobiia bacterium]